MSYIMKKTLFCLASVLLFDCCTNTELTPAEPEVCSIHAVMENDGTKTSVTDEGYFTWSDGDKIWLHTTSGNVEATLAKGAGTPSAEFTYGPFLGTLTGKAVYPYGNHSIANGKLNMELPASYNLGAVTDNSNAAMYGEYLDGSLKFTHLAGVMRFDFKDVPIGTNHFKITLDKKINGIFTAELVDNCLTLSAVESYEEADKSVTINFDPLETVQDLRICVPLPVGTYRSLALELNTETRTVYSYSKNVTNTINRKTLLLMPAISMGGSIGGDIENDGSVGGDIENGEDGALYIKTEDGSSFADLSIISADGGYLSSLNLDTNVPTGEFVYELPENAVTWMHATVSEIKGVKRLNVQVYKNKGFARSATIKVRAKNDNNACLEVKFAQESGVAEYATYSARGEWGNSGGELISVGQNSLEYKLPAEADGVVDGIYLDTNVPEYKLIISENAESWLGGCGLDYANDVIVIVGTNNDKFERTGALELRCRHTDKLLYTVNITQSANPNAYVNLSSGGTANCYIVSEAGGYRFTPTKGNSNASVGSILSVEVLWETENKWQKPATGSLVKSVRYYDGDILFMTPDEFVEGNAVIAAKDRSGNILWSWHVWLTDAPIGHVYDNNAGVMLDRNLGALSSEIQTSLSAGLLYQWGRKDPFPGAYSMTSNDAEQAGATGTWPANAASTASTGTIDYATKNPMTFITSNNLNYDWHYSGTNSIDATRWASVKTQYDPCPAGWRVPDGGPDGIWAKAKTITTSSSRWNYSYHTYSYSTTDENGNSVKANYPAAPSLHNNVMYDPDEAEGWIGYYWSCTSNQQQGNRLYVFSVEYPGRVDTTDYRAASYAYPVRCQKE